MVKRKHKNNVIEKIQRINILKGVLIKNGNKERIFKYIFHIFKNLKETKNVPVSLRKNPAKMLETALYKSAPFFAYKRLVKSGKLYEIPVPVSKKRATFIASSWIQKIAKKRTNEGNPFHYFIAKEIENILQKKGGVLEQFHLYTAEGLEKNIFKKFVRKKYPTVSRSKSQNAYKAMLSRINRAEKRKKFAKKKNYTLENIMQIKQKHKARDYRQNMKKKRKKLKKKFTKNLKTLKSKPIQKVKSKKKINGKKY